MINHEFTLKQFTKINNKYDEYIEVEDHTGIKLCLLNDGKHFLVNKFYNDNCCSTKQTTKKLNTILTQA